MLENLIVVLVKPKFPENIGSVARACLNMGVREMVIVDPLNFNMDKAMPLATLHAKDILETARIVDTLAEALTDVQAAYGTTARTGGWRKGIMAPGRCARVVHERIADGGKVALVFGPEDRGLTNDETSLCTGLVTIQTARTGTSLNLAQAVLILLYECFRVALDRPVGGAGECGDDSGCISDNPALERGCTVKEQEVLTENIKESLLAIDYLREDNPDYWLLPVRRMLARVSLKRAEFNVLMGICRQIKWVAGLAGKLEKK